MVSDAGSTNQMDLHWRPFECRIYPLYKITFLTLNSGLYTEVDSNVYGKAKDSKNRKSDIVDLQENR